MKRLLVVDTSVRVVYHSILVLSLYFLFAGHNQPGGGFVGGLTAGAAISFRYVAGGVAEVRRAFPLRPWTIMGGGLLISVLTAILPILTGNALLEHAAFERQIAVLGTVKTTSALPFDIGVYLVVLGLILMMFEAFGDDEAVDEASGSSVRGDALEADSVLKDVFDLEQINDLQMRRRQRDRL
jgi:multisubunit Na+/H+ antiporter MnhB subunit